MEKINTAKRIGIAFLTSIVFLIVILIVMGGQTVIVGQIVINIERILRIVPCHRMKSRSLTIKGYTLPLCARCAGILLGYLFFPLFMIFSLHIPLWLGLLINIPMIVDGWTQKRKYRVSNNALRFTTGLMSGLGQSIIIVSVSELIIRALLLME